MVMQLQAKSRMCLICAPLVRKALLIGKDGFAPLQYPLCRAPLLYARPVARGSIGVMGVRLSKEIGVHMLGLPL